MKAIIMAGGEGTRLRPLTCCLPKPMAPICGTPVMEHILNLLKQHGFTQIGATLQYLPGMVADYFGDGSAFGVNMHYFIEDKPLGTAGSVKNTGNFIDGTFLIISGDALTDIDLSAALQFHKERGSKATLVLKRVETPLEYGVVVTDADGSVRRFLEKPGWSEVFSDTVNTGIYILEPEVMDLVKAGVMFDFSKDLFPKLLSQGTPMYGYVADGYWCDIGDLNAYIQCNFDALDKKVKIRFDAAPRAGGLWVHEKAVLEDGADVSGPAYIGSGARIGKNAVIHPYSVIGAGAAVASGAVVEKSVVWHGCSIMSGAGIRGSIVCDKAVVKENAALLDGAVIGRGSVVGQRAVVHSGVKIWNDKTVDDDSEVTSSLIWGIKSGRTLFGDKGITGDVNVEITPEYASRLASAFAAVKGQGCKLAVSTDISNASLMLKEAAVSGMLSSGAQVLDFGQQPVPITRAGIRFYGLGGGMHISAGSRPGSVKIDIVDSTGANINRQMERKLESLFMREDFTRVQPDSIKELVSLTSYRLYYLRDIVNKTRRGKLGMNVLLGVSSPLNKGLIVSLLSDLGCRYKLYNEQGDVQSREYLMGFAKATRDGGFDLGAVIDNSCENLALCDNKGRLISDDFLSCAIALIIFRSKPSATYVARLSAPGVIETIASRYGGKVVRTKESPIEVMSKLSEGSRDVSLSEQFVLEFDAIGGLIKVMDHLKSNNTSLAGLIEEIPAFYMVKEEMPVQSADKGLVIRRIIEKSRDKRLDLTEGVKIFEQGGWVLVIPDAQKPAFRIITEGYTEEIAQELTNDYIQRIKSIVSQEQGLQR